ncbi:MAG: hypothetical protein VYA11_06815 [Planctomycetota bacterium]|nr:hypothetical protein [Planctomycetota bacterium]
MRLTLRTLLAYLDNILEPEDRAVLEKKIQESEFAQDLIRRSRETVNDQELSALDPIGYGTREDPNTVAEYLDNTMAREQIEEFERQCIENGAGADTRLAEVTSCHHILTMVLGDPVQFSASSRDRMYQIVADQTAAAQIDSYANRQEISSAESDLQGDNEHAIDTYKDSDDGFDPSDLLPGSNVPEYLRDEEQPRRWLPIVATALVAAVVTGVLLILFESNVDLENQNSSTAIAKSTSSNDDFDSTAATEENPELKDNLALSASAAKVTTDSPLGDLTEEIAPIQSNGISADTSTEDVTLAGDNEKPSTNSVPAEEASEPTIPSVASATTSENSTNKTSESNEVSTDDISDTSGETSNSNSIPQDEENAEESSSGQDVAKEETDKVNQVLGRLVSDDQILLVTSDGFDQLRWLSPKSNLKQGHQLLALPTFRPNLSLLAFTVELDGGSLLELLELDGGGTPTVRLSYGRMVVRTNFNGAKIRLKIDTKRTIALTLNSTETAIGIEVVPKAPIGRNPATSGREYAINIYSLSGSVDWQEATLQGVIDAGQLQALGSMPPTEPESFASAPEWLTEVKVSNLEKRAVPVVRDVVQEDRPVKLSFQELVSKRRQEVKRLALRCCAYIGYFDPLVEALGDENMNRHWENCATDLSMAAKRHPEYANRVRETMERLRSDKGTDLYRMLWGYTDDGLLKQGQAEQLVEFLSSEDLDFRVLSHWNLKNITGKRYTFQPADKSESKRRVSIKRYENLLDKGEIKRAAN